METNSIIKVSISTYGTVNLEAGWTSKEVSLPRQSATVEDVLHLVKLMDGRAVFDLIADKSGIRESYGIWLNGRVLSDRTALHTRLKNEDQIAIGSSIRAIGGG